MDLGFSVSQFIYLFIFSFIPFGDFMAFVPSIYPVIRGYEILPFPQAPQLFQPAPELLDCPGKKQSKRIDDMD